jgi:hypothetical protein
MDMEPLDPAFSPAATHLVTIQGGEDLPDYDELKLPFG